MKAKVPFAVTAIGGSLAAVIGCIFTGGVFGYIFDEGKRSFTEVLIQCALQITQVSDGGVIFLLMVSATILTLHLSGVPKPWVPFFRITLALFIPYMAWLLSLLALATSAPGSLHHVLFIVGHPLWLLAFFLVGLTWWIVEMVKARKRYLKEGWA